MRNKSKNDICKKLILAESLGVRLIYCRECEVVELELGTISIMLSPDKIQRMANLMMKASLSLDHLQPSHHRGDVPSTASSRLH